jgi:hypothetical protein
MLTVSLNGSSQVSFGHAKPNQSILIEAYRILFGEKSREKIRVSHPHTPRPAGTAILAAIWRLSDCILPYP